MLGTSRPPLFPPISQNLSLLFHFLITVTTGTLPRISAVTTVTTISASTVTSLIVFFTIRVRALPRTIMLSVPRQAPPSGAATAMGLGARSARSPSGWTPGCTTSAVHSLLSLQYALIQPLYKAIFQRIQNAIVLVRTRHFFLFFFFSFPTTVRIPSRGAGIHKTNSNTEESNSKLTERHGQRTQKPTDPRQLEEKKPHRPPLPPALTWNSTVT